MSSEYMVLVLVTNATVHVYRLTEHCMSKINYTTISYPELFIRLLLLLHGIAYLPGVPSPVMRNYESLKFSYKKEVSLFLILTISH